MGNVGQQISYNSAVLFRRKMVQRDLPHAERPHKPGEGARNLSFPLSVHMHTCAHTHAYTRAHTNACAHTCTPAHTCKLQLTSPEMFSLPGRLELRVKELQVSLHPASQSSLCSVGRRCLKGQHQCSGRVPGAVQIHRQHRQSWGRTPAPPSPTRHLCEVFWR